MLDDGVYVPVLRWKLSGLSRSEHYQNALSSIVEEDKTGAGIPNPSTVRDIEYGRDTKLSSLQAVAKALGLRLELVEA